MDGRLFTLGISGILSAVDATSGARLWHKPAPPLAPTYSTSQSPLFENGQVIVHVDGYGKGALTSFNPTTGAVNWEWTGDGPAYGSPIVVEFAGTRQVITFTENLHHTKAFAPLARYQLSDSATWAAPSISGNRLFVKGLSQLTLWTID